MTRDANRWRCECGHVCYSDDMLRAPNPFDPEDEVTGCPRCKLIPQWEELCDEAGCLKAATCGFPVSPIGYRRTCAAHSDFA